MRGDSQHGSSTGRRLAVTGGRATFSTDTERLADAAAVDFYDRRAMVTLQEHAQLIEQSTDNTLGLANVVTKRSAGDKRRVLKVRNVKPTSFLGYKSTLAGVQLFSDFAPEQLLQAE
eukprot:SAG31_NODE_15420_length_756_cov_1.082192_1_plen_116_part_01